MRLTPARDAAPAEWLVASLTDFAASVDSLVPRGFEAYVRVFHPAYRRGAGIDDWAPARWSEVAAATGRTAHPAMQLAALIGFLPSGSYDLPGVYDDGPRVGSLPRRQTAALAEALARHTATPDRCWFAAWSGYAGLRDDVAQAPRFALPGREYHLLQGAATAATEVVEDSTDHERSQRANLWWPDDRAWCVASEIDLDTTYVGCSAACRAKLVRLPDLEALAIDPTSGIAFDSDAVNRP